MTHHAELPGALEFNTQPVPSGGRAGSLEVPANRDGVHLAHCFQGENLHNCKYGNDEYCPAKPSGEQTEREPQKCWCSDCGNQWISDGEPVGCPRCAGGGTIGFEPAARLPKPAVAYVSDQSYPECTETCAVCGAVYEPGTACGSCGNRPAEDAEEQIVCPNCLSAPCLPTCKYYERKFDAPQPASQPHQFQPDEKEPLHCAICWQYAAWHLHGAATQSAAPELPRYEFNEDHDEDEDGNPDLYPDEKLEQRERQLAEALRENVSFREQIADDTKEIIALKRNLQSAEAQLEAIRNAAKGEKA